MRRGVLRLPHPGRGSAACPRFSPGAFEAEAVPRVLLAVNFVAEEAVCLGALRQCVQKCFSLDNNPRSMTCRSGVVSVAIVVRTARTTASVPTPEPGHVARPDRLVRARFVCPPCRTAARPAGTGAGPERAHFLMMCLRG